MAATIPTELDAVFSHCTGYPGGSNPASFVRYMRACQLETTFFFAATNDKTRDQTLAALQTQRAVADFVLCHQGMESRDPARLQREFLDFAAKLKAMPTPPPAIVPAMRTSQTGGHNE